MADEEENAKEGQEAATATKSEDGAQDESAGQDEAGVQDESAGQGEAGAEGEGGAQKEVHSAELKDLHEEETAQANGKIDMVLDVSVPISVSLGRTSMAVRDLLKLGTGSVVELDRIAGEPVDIFVRDVRFATGEVVVADDRFAIRIKEILDPGANAQKEE